MRAVMEKNLANIIMGIIKPDNGVIELMKKLITLMKIKLNIGYVDQTSKLLDDSLKMNIAFSENLN